MHVSYAKADGGYTVEFSEDDGRKTQRYVALNGARAYPDLPDQNSNADYYEAIARILRGATAPFKVLDGGCGSGYGSEILARTSPREFQHDILGIDVDADVAEYAALRHRLASFVSADAAKLGFREGYFDMIVDVDGLPHMEDPAGALRNYHRMLCDVGLLFIAVPNPDRDAVMELIFGSGFEVAHELCDNKDLLFLGCIRHKPVNDLAAFWENSADDVARHHCDGLDDWAEFVDEKFGGYISDTEGDSILEWGCGKGDISRKLAARVPNLHLVDILDESLQRATAALETDGRAPASTTRVEALDQVALPVEHVDVLLCTAVVQHFPTVAYWREVAAKWNALTPDTIVLQTRHADETRETKNYRTEYFTALWLSTEEVVSQFPDYEVVFHHLDTKDDHLWSAITHYEFFVLKRRG